MSRAIDEKIVKLSMDNESFLSKVKDTLRGLMSLSRGAEKVKSVDVSKADSSVKSLGQSLSKISTEKLASGLENVKNRFSALREIGVGALRNIGATLASTAANTIKDWSGVTDGFSEYGEKMKAVQVITANTQGKSSAQEIATALDNLNHYADKTVYSFTDMTTSIGTFTAAGVGLNDATDAIQGLSNWAAESGTNTTDLSRAETQLSQALASGTVRLQDWNSVQNAGGLGGKKFQLALEATAKSMGKGRDMTKSFRDSLQDGWLTSEVLLKTLRKFKNDKSMENAATQAHTFSDAIGATKEAIGSGWASIFEDLFGNLEQSTKLWTALQNAMGNIINNHFNGIDAVVKSFVKLGGMTDVIDVVVNGFHLLQRTLGAVQKGFHDVFPPVTGKRIDDLVVSINIFIARIMPAEKQLREIRTVSEGVFSVFDIGIKVIKAAANIFKSMIPDNMGGSLLKLASNIAKVIINFDKGIAPGKEFKGVLDSIHGASNSFAAGISSAFGGMDKFLTWVDKAAKALGRFLQPALLETGKGFKKFFDSLSFGDLLGGGALGALAYGANRLKKVGAAIEEFGESIKSAFKFNLSDLKMLNQLKDALVAMTTAVKAASLLAIGAGILMIAKALQVLSKLKAMDISKGLETIAVSLYAMVKTLQAIAKINFGGGTTKAIAMILSVSLAINELAKAMTTISKIQGKDIAKSLGSLAVTMGLLVSAVNLMSLSGKKMSTGSLQLIAIATSVVELSAALTMLSKIKSSSLIKALFGVGVALGELAAFVLVVNKTRMSPTAALGVIAVANALLLMSGAVAVLGSLNSNSIVKGLGSIAFLLGEVAGFAKLVNGANLTVASIGIVAVAGALNLMIPPMLAFGSMPFGAIGKGLIAVAGALTVIVVAMRASSSNLIGAAGIVAVAAALNLLVVPITLLAHLSIGQLAMAMGGLAATLGIVAVAGVALTPGAAGLLAFAGAIGILGLGVMAIGTGLASFATALTTLAKISSSNAAAIKKNFNTMLKATADTIPNIVRVVVNAVVSIAAGIAKAAPSIANSGLTLIEGLLKAINSHIGKLVSTGLSIVTKIIEGLTEGLGPLVDAGVKLIISFINGMANAIRKNGPKIINSLKNLLESMLELIVTGLQGILNTLFGWFPPARGLIRGFGKSAKEALRTAFDVKPVGAKGGKNFADGVNSRRGDAKRAGKALGDNAKSGSVLNLTANGNKAGSTFVRGANSHRGNAHSAGKALGSNVRSGSVTSLNGQGSHAGSTFASGARGMSGAARSAGNHLASSGRSGAGSISWRSAGKNAGLGFGQGISHATGSVIRYAQGLASSALGALKSWLRIKSPSRKAMVLGDYFGQGFGVGIDGQTKNIISKSTSLAKSAVSAIKSQAGYIQDAMNDAMSIQPVITPTVDTRYIDRANLNMSGVVSAANGTVPYTNISQPATVKIDASDLKEQLKGLGLNSGDNIDMHFTIYGELNEATARKWAPTLAVGLEKARGRKLASGGGA